MNDSNIARKFMQIAIKLADYGLYSCMPNPKVGCVITDCDNNIIAKGAHQISGQNHAEIIALDQAKNKSINSIIYVTLEPCCHQGKTPPCANAIIKARVKKVVIAMEDPNPKVAGKGIAKLRQAGIEVVVGLCREQAEQINKGFIKRMLYNKPLVRLKMALSIDGRSAMANGDSKWITCVQSRIAVQELRAKSCAIITGIGTVIADDPHLNVRYKNLVALKNNHCIIDRQPLRVIVDSQLRIPASAKILHLPGKIAVATVSNNKTELSKLIDQGVKIINTPKINNKVDLNFLLNQLAIMQCNEVLVEAGNKLAGDFIASELVDEITIMFAPKLMGSSALPAFNLPLNSMKETINWNYDSIEKIGECFKITLKKN